MPPKTSLYQPLKRYLQRQALENLKENGQKLGTDFMP